MPSKKENLSEGCRKHSISIKLITYKFTEMMTEIGTEREVEIEIKMIRGLKMRSQSLYLNSSIYQNHNYR